MKTAMTRPSKMIVAYWALSVALGVSQAYLRANALDLRVATVGSLVPFAIVLFAWCKADCTRRGITPPAGATLLVAGVAVIGIPYYYFRTLTSLKALGHVVAAYLILGIGLGSTALADQAVSRLFTS